MALHKMVQGYGQFHRSASTTARFYIDSTNLEYINTAFELYWLSPPSSRLNVATKKIEFGKGKQGSIVDLNRNQSNDAHTPVS